MNGFAQDFTALVIILVGMLAIFGVLWVAPTYAFLRLMGWI